MRSRQLLLAGAGLLAVVAACVIAVVRAETVPETVGPGAVGWLVVLGALGAAAWLRYRATRSAPDEAAAPWSGTDPIVAETPEATPDTQPLSGRELVLELDQASTAARQAGEIETGLEVLRPALRDTYVLVARHAGQDESTARAALDRGTWTDDPAAAAALSPDVDPPPRSLVERLRDWLYPGRAVRRRTRAAVDALAAAADESVATVVGTDAPRRIPVYEPTLAERRLGPTGEIGGPDPTPAAPREIEDAGDVDEESTATPDGGRER